jgi:signal peptide peptidase SppA
MPERTPRKYRRVLTRVMSEPWAILPEKAEAIGEVIALRSQGFRYTPAEIQARLGGVSREAGPSGQGGKIAVLNLFGTITQRASAFQEFSGGTSCEAFGKAFREALHSADVSAIVIQVDSPGGQVPGVPELAEEIYQARGQKPIIAFANPTMASAAYWIASAADEIVAAPSAGTIGSLGVLTIHTDVSEQEAREGVRRTIIQSVPYKAAGNPYEPLSEETRGEFQHRVDSIHRTFMAAVAKHRGIPASRVQADYGQGRVYLADEAVAHGLADRVATLDELLTELGASKQPRQVPHSSPARAAAPTQSKETSQMDPQVKQALVAAGLIDAAAGETEAAAALKAFFLARGQAVPESAAATVAGLQSPALTIAQAATPLQLPAAPAAPQAPAGLSAADIIGIVQSANLPADQKLTLSGELIRQQGTISLSQVLDKVNAAAAAYNAPAGPAPRVVKDERENLHEQARDAILCRTWGHDLPGQIFNSRSQDLTDWRPNRRASAMQSLPHLARQCLIASGVPVMQVDQLSGPQIAMAMMGTPLNQLGIFASSDGPAYNVSGMFSNILYDASNVILRRSYSEVNTTFERWMKRGESLRDFKAVHKVIAGELPDPKAIPEDGEFEEVTHGDERTSYKLVVWGEIWSCSWQLIVNDQLGAFTELPMKHGRAMRRKQNKLAYQVLKDNPTMPDTGALFNSTAQTTAGGHNNLTTGANAPSVSTLNGMMTKMMTMQGLDTASGTFLNIQPRYMVVPPALRGTVLELLGSMSNPASSNSGVRNIWQNGLEPVIDAELSAAAGGSDTAYYLAADSRDVDTIEYAYLQGLETPAINQEVAFDRLALRYRIHQAFAVKEIDYRGLQKHAGA